MIGHDDTAATVLMKLTPQPAQRLGCFEKRLASAISQRAYRRISSPKWSRPLSKQASRCWPKQMWMHRLDTRSALFGPDLAIDIDGLQVLAYQLIDVDRETLRSTLDQLKHQLNLVSLGFDV